MGISPSYLNRLERGTYHNPSPRVLVAAAALYRIPQADLLTAAGYPLSSELPTLEAYLHATRTSLPGVAISEIMHFCEFIQQRYKDK
jgi:transcriptional regulator with XRE-family HTH domain